MISKFLIVGGTAFLLGLGMGFARADEQTPSATLTMEEAIRNEIAGAYPGAKVDLAGEARWTRGEMPESPSSIKFLGENGRGEAQIQVRGVAEINGAATIVTAEARVPFTASVNAYVASRRMGPNEKLDPGLFVVRPIDVARGQGRELRGIIFPSGESLAGLESRQTILEGQFVTTSAVQRAPDLRRGDLVQIRILSGGLTVNLQGTAEESAYIDSKVRVLSTKTKRQLMGQLKAGSIVEVQL